MSNIKRIYDYFESKYNLGYAGLIKAIAFASMYIKNKDIMPLSVLIIAPPGQFKTRTTIELDSIFSNRSLIHLGSDFTIHSLVDRFHSGKKCNNKTLSINDLTLLFSSKTQRTKARLVNALAEVLSDGEYQYGERNTPKLVFKARINIIANITKNSYMQNRRNFLDNTFIERLLPFFYALSDNQQLSFSNEISERKKLKFWNKLRLNAFEIDNFSDYKHEIIKVAYSIMRLTNSPSLPRCVEKAKALIGGMCIIENSTQVKDEYFQYVKELIPHLHEEGSRSNEIISLYKQGVDIKEICRRLNFNSNYPYKVIQRAREKGILN